MSFDSREHLASAKGLQLCMQASKFFLSRYSVGYAIGSPAPPRLLFAWQSHRRLPFSGTGAGTS